MEVMKFNVNRQNSVPDGRAQYSIQYEYSVLRAKSATQWYR